MNRSKMITLRLTPAEYAKLKKLAGKGTVSDLLRNGALKKRIKKPSKSQ